MKWMTGLLQNGVRPGDPLMLLDAIVYALYSVQLKRRSLLIPGLAGDAGEHDREGTQGLHRAWSRLGWWATKSPDWGTDDYWRTTSRCAGLCQSVCGRIGRDGRCGSNDGGEKGGRGRASAGGGPHSLP